jgi:2,3-bisphosphoglycerate-independent phosphoglycerate mutase
MEKSRAVFENHPVNLKRISDGKKPATQIWLWGQGKKPALPTMKDRFGLTGAVVTAVDLVKGIGLLLGLEVPVVEGVTGFVDTNYEGKADAVLEALHHLGFAYAHIEAPDEAGHIGDGELKRRAIEDVDRRFLKRLLDGLNTDPALQPYRLLLLPDHPTPISIKTHIRKDVPYFLYDSRRDERGTLSEFSESAMQRYTGKRVPGFQLMDFLLERNG